MRYITKQKQSELEDQYGEKFANWKSELAGKYSIVPHEILFSSKLTDGERMVYIKLLALANSQGALYHSNEALAEKLECKVDNVAKYLRLLKKKDLLVTLTVGTNTKRVICLTPYIHPKG